MQTQATTFRDLVTEAVDKRQEAVSITLVDGLGTVHFVPEGVARTCPDLEGIFQQAWDSCDVDGDAKLRPTDRTIARATGKRSPIPPELVALRIQFWPIERGQGLLARLLWKQQTEASAVQ